MTADGVTAEHLEQFKQKCSHSACGEGIEQKPTKANQSATMSEPSFPWLSSIQIRFPAFFLATGFLDVL
jgi:hypothetical protein